MDELRSTTTPRYFFNFSSPLLFRFEKSETTAEQNLIEENKSESRPRLFLRIRFVPDSRLAGPESNPKIISLQSQQSLDQVGY